MKKTEHWWHEFRIYYYQLLAKDCLDISTKKALLEKAEYHQNRVHLTLYSK